MIIMHRVYNRIIRYNCKNPQFTLYVIDKSNVKVYNTFQTKHIDLV